MTTRPTFADGLVNAREIAVAHGLTWADLTEIGRAHLAMTFPDSEGMGSSDVNAHLAHLGNHEADLLTFECQRMVDRTTLVTQIARSTGRTVEQALADLTALFAPAVHA